MISNLFRKARFKRSMKAASHASKNGQWSEAARHYSAALRRRPGLSWVWVQNGHALKESDDLQAAADAYRTAVELNPVDEETCYHLADVYRRLKRPADAEAALRLALSIQGKQSSDAKETGYIVINRAKAEAALSGATSSVLQKLDEIATRFPATENFVHYGHFLKDAGQPQEAEFQYRRAIALSPGDADAYLHLGHALKLQDRMREAIYAYRVAMNLSQGKTSHVHQSARDELLGLGANLATELTVPPALAQAPDGPTWADGIRKGDFFTLSERLLSLPAGSTPPEVVDFTAQMLMMVGRSDEAYAMLDALAAKGSASDRTYLIMAEHSEIIGDLTAATTLYERALSTRPIYGAAFEALVRLNAFERIFEIVEPTVFGQDVLPAPGRTLVAAAGRSPGMILPADFAETLRQEMVARGLEMKTKGNLAQSRLFLEDARLIRQH